MKRWNRYLFFLYTHFCFVTNKMSKIYRKKKQDETNQKIWSMLIMKQNETMKQIIFFINPFLFQNKRNE